MCAKQNHFTTNFKKSLWLRCDVVGFDDDDANECTNAEAGDGNGKI